MSYLCSEGFNPGAEHGITPMDPALGLPWPSDIEPILSDKDRDAPTLAEAKAAGPAAQLRRLRRLPGQAARPQLSRPGRGHSRHVATPSTSAGPRSRESVDAERVVAHHEPLLARAGSTARFTDSCPGRLPPPTSTIAPALGCLPEVAPAPRPRPCRVGAIDGPRTRSRRSGQRSIPTGANDHLRLPAPALTG